MRPINKSSAAHPRFQAQVRRYNEACPARLGSEEKYSMDEQQQITPEQAQELIDAMREAVNEVPSYVERDLSKEAE